MAYTLHRLLADYDMSMLRALAQARGVDLTTNRQAEAADQMALALLDPLSVRVALALLSPAGQEALDALLAAGGRLRATQFARGFGTVRPSGPSRLERDASWQSPSSPAEELLYLGLIGFGFDRDTAGVGEFAFVPTDLRPLLPAPTADDSFAVRTVEAPARERDGGSALVRDLFAYLVLLQARDVRPLAEGRLGPRDLAALRRRLADSDGRRLAFLQRMANVLAFSAEQEGVLRLDAHAVKRWLSAPLWSQLADLQGAWRSDPAWDDLRRVPSLAFDEETNWRLRTDPVAARETVLDLLGHCPPDAWWLVSSFVAAVKKARPDLLRPDGDYASWYVRDAVTGTYLPGFESWDRVEGAFLADLLTGPLYWLGVVTLGAAGDETACRLTESGARLLVPGIGEPETDPIPSILVGANLRVEVPPPQNLYTRFQLERFADLESESPCRYRLTVDSLGRALARGLRVEQVLGFLQQTAGRPVPAGAAGQLRLWAGRFDSVHLEAMALLRVENERVLKELAVLPETRALIAQILSPTTALVRHEDLARLKQELRAQGYLRHSPEDDASSRRM